MKKSTLTQSIKGLVLTSFALATLTLGCSRSFASSDVTAGNDITGSTAGTKAPQSGILDQMSQNPSYWMNYLNDCLKEETSPKNNEVVESVVDHMQSDPVFWPNYLRMNINPVYQAGVLNEMEQDSQYWPHYIQLSQLQ
ncbi:MAG TPA: hypothetical protein P5531_05585 [Bacteroidales bacterium]|nr:hypothetical protein [Bacteroidales bacterium]HSA42879.1 hypothetical protein [Bacteroidales bacterium]